MEHLLEVARARKLDRVGATYAVVAWVLVQAASIALPAFSAPAWTMRWLILIAMAGFPLSLTLAWFSTRRSDSVGFAARRPFDTRDWLLFGLIGLVAVLLIAQLSFEFSNRAASGVTPAVQAQNQTSSIAVLPFANLSGDANKVYFSDGIADQLISELSQTPSLRVAARSSSFAFRGKDMDVKTIAKLLNVRSVLEGSVREAGNRVRIAAELVDASNGFQIWSASYDRDLTNILTLQDDIARAITQAIAQRFLGHRVIANRPRAKPQAIDPEAYKAYLQGQYYFAQRTPDSIARSIQLFTQATALAPEFADGFAALADAHATAALNYQVPGSMPAATEAAKKALALDPNNPTALMARATLEILQWRWRDAAADLRRLEKLHLNTASLWHMRAIFFDYMGLQQLAGMAEARAVQLDPLSFIDRYNLATYRMVQKQYADADRIAAEAWALQPGNPDVQQLKVQIALGLHDRKTAERILAALMAQSGKVASNIAAVQFYLDVDKKDFAAARKLVDAVAKQFPVVGLSATDMGNAYAIIGDTDAALKWYQRAVDEHDAQFLRVPYASPEYAKLFADPRWKALRSQPAIQDWEAARAEIAREFERGE